MREALRSKRPAIQEILEEVRLYKQFGDIRRELRGFIPSTPAAMIAGQIVDNENRMNEQYDRVLEAVSRLDRVEREIIEHRFLDEEELFDYQVMEALDLRESRFYKFKAKALKNLAFALGLE